MIALSSVLAAYEAMHRLLHPQQVNHLWAVAGAAVIGFLGNELVARYRIRVGRQIGSAALVADGLHARTDGFTSLAVLLGAGGVALGLPWADPVVGLVITVAILGVLRSAVKQVAARVMDAVDPTIVHQAPRPSPPSRAYDKSANSASAGSATPSEQKSTSPPIRFSADPSPRPRTSRRSAAARQCASPHRRHSSRQPRWRPPRLVD
jgi:Cation efflux family